MPDLTARLSETHRAAQLRLGARTIVGLRAVWPLLDPEDLDGSFEEWFAAVQPIVEANRAQSAQLASGYLAALRALTIGAGGDVVHAAPLDARQLITSMIVTGPVSIRANVGRMTLTEAVDIAQGRTAAAAVRHTLNGGRETVTETIKADRRAVGYQRITSARACEFCSMLAGRGPVFKEDTADFPAHDGCGCAAEPVYR